VTRSVSQASAIALSVVAFVSFAPLFAAFADPPAEPAPTPGAPAMAPTPTQTTAAATPSLSEPAPTPGWAEAGPNSGLIAQHPDARRSVHRHYAYRYEHRTYSDNPVRTVAMGVAGGAADLGSVAAYPFYCFPNYGSCSVRVPYHY
jgi:hypothetical protein